MWWSNENEARAEIKARAIARRRFLYGTIENTCYCDYCEKAPAHEYHEIISRGRTVTNEQAREWSFNEAICSLLCHNCHTRYAPTVVGRLKLLEKNIEIYGREAVEFAFYRIPEQYRQRIELP